MFHQAETHGNVRHHQVHGSRKEHRFFEHRLGLGELALDLDQAPTGARQRADLRFRICFARCLGEHHHRVLRARVVTFLFVHLGEQLPAVR